jgi:hypothetical protein
MGIIPGNHNGEATPVPIPNTEVKLFGADGTARGAEWESRSLPGFFRLFGFLKGVEAESSFQENRAKLIFSPLISFE